MALNTIVSLCNTYLCKNVRVYNKRREKSIYLTFSEQQLVRMINVQYISVKSITEVGRLIENKLGENLHQLSDSKKLNICQNIRYLMTI